MKSAGYFTAIRHKVGHSTPYTPYAWDLVLDRLGRQVYGAAVNARTWWARRRHGLGGGSSASAYSGEGAD